jgi:NADH:ubiquinone reductase (H+-translocating)
MKFEVVIAGGGFAGAYCARTLARKLGADAERRVALVSEDNVLAFQPMLAEVAGSSLSPLDVVNPLRTFCRGVNVLHGAVRTVDWEKKTLLLDAGRFTSDHELQFEHLVLTIGSAVDMNQVPGMSQHGLPLKTVADALRLRAAVINRLEEANLATGEASRRRLLTIVVVGGGYTGVELAGQLIDFLESAHRLYSNLRAVRPRVVLVHSRGHLLAEIGETLGDYAQRVLEQRGIEVLLNQRVTEVTSDRAILNDGSAIETHTVISTIGNRASPVLLELCRQLGVEPERGRIPTDPTMRVARHPQLWAAGDCAAVPWKGESSCPPTAQFAQRQGVQLGRNLARVLSGETPQPFTHRHLGQLATIGRHAAVAEVMGFHFRGFFAWWLWRSIYLAKLPGLLRKLRVMSDWAFELFFPRDISLLLPAAHEPLRPMHFRKGEVVFAKGTAARGFVHVQSGSVVVEECSEEPQTFRPGSCLGCGLQDADGIWNCTAVAAEGTDVVVLTGLARDLFRTDSDQPAARR